MCLSRRRSHRMNELNCNIVCMHYLTNRTLLTGCVFSREGRSIIPHVPKIREERSIAPHSRSLLTCNTCATRGMHTSFFWGASPTSHLFISYLTLLLARPHTTCNAYPSITTIVRCRISRTPGCSCENKVKYAYIVLTWQS